MRWRYAADWTQSGDDRAIRAIVWPNWRHVGMRVSVETNRHRRNNLKQMDVPINDFSLNNTDSKRSFWRIDIFTPHHRTDIWITIGKPTIAPHCTQHIHTCVNVCWHRTIGSIDQRSTRNRSATAAMTDTIETRLNMVLVTIKQPRIYTLIPTSPVKWHGMRIEPPTSPPIPTNDPPAAINAWKILCTENGKTFSGKPKFPYFVRSNYRLCPKNYFPFTVSIINSCIYRFTATRTTRCSIVGCDWIGRRTINRIRTWIAQKTLWNICEYKWNCTECL